MLVEFRAETKKVAPKQLMQNALGNEIQSRMYFMMIA